MFNRSFYHFFFGFVVIITLAFGVLVWAGNSAEPVPVDNVALPQ